MKILTPEQIKSIDEYTIHNEPISSIDLMERAANTATDWILDHAFSDSYYIFCGMGNNGGDGLAIARLLSKRPIPIHVFLIKFSDKLSEDAQINLERLYECESVNVHQIEDISELELCGIKKNTIIIDAIFGSGLNRIAKGLSKKVITLINSLQNPIISIDMPSGLFANQSVNFKDYEGVITATHTLTFQLPKLTFLLSENAEFVGKWHVLDIGLLSRGIQMHKTPYSLIEKQDVYKIKKPRKKFSHKGHFGHALLIAGSYGKMGASILASKACLKSGVGLLTTHIPHWGYQIMQTSVPEAMTSIDRSEMIFTEFPELSNYNAIGIGPGLDNKKNSANAFEELLDKIADQKLVIDADGLNILSENKFLLVKLPKNTILTPHPKEFQRLAGCWKNEVERLNILIEFCKQYNVITVLKGAHTVIALPNGTCSFNSSGNPGMATAGSGDALTGIILALLAQGYSEKDSAILGVYLHGLAGDITLKKESEESLIASDIIYNLGAAFNHLRNQIEFI